MAKRRMFSLDVIDTDRFLEMPVSTQALYFHLGMRADDDGFVSSPKTITRSVNCTNDDLRILASKGYIVFFETGVIVIADWKLNNYIRSDRYQPTRYQQEKKLINLDNNENVLSPNGIPLGVPEGIPSDSQTVDKRLTQVRLGKDSIGKEVCGQPEVVTSPRPAKKKEIKHFIPPTVEDVKQYCLENNYVLDAERFVDFYECKGWMVGKNKMKDWKAAVRTWIRKDKEGTVKRAPEKPPEEPAQPIDLWSD